MSLSTKCRPIDLYRTCEEKNREIYSTAQEAAEVASTSQPKRLKQTHSITFEDNPPG
jgi:hypothetical protein